MFPQVQNTLRKRNGGREARGVLVYVEAVIEVRDARPFEGDVLVERNAIAEVLCVQLLIDAAECIGGDAGALCGELSHFQLEFSEHGLAVQRCAELLQEVV